MMRVNGAWIQLPFNDPVPDGITLFDPPPA